MNREIIELAKRFHISAISRDKWHPPEGLSCDEYLLELLRTEAALRDQNAERARIRLARLPTYKGFEDFDLGFQKGITAYQLELLGKLEWLEQLFNLILIGPPGTGKTHIALAIGNKALRSSQTALERRALYPSQGFRRSGYRGLLQRKMPCRRRLYGQCLIQFHGGAFICQISL